MVQFERPKVSYFISENLKILPAQALHNEYLVIPDGGSGTKMERMQKATMRYQLKGAPNINQDELTKDVLSADDARLIRTLLIPGDQKQQTEAADEAVELQALKDGFPMPVGRQEDHLTRIGVLIGWLQKQHAIGAPADPVAIQRVLQHAQQHFVALEQTNPDAAKQVKQKIVQMMQSGNQPQAPQPAAPPQLPQ